MSEDVCLEWRGKSEAKREAEKVINKRLRHYPEESLDYATTGNIFIEGDNLDALKIMQETYRGKIKMIYIDPPYNTGNDLVYRNSFRHSEWLSMMYPRLVLARRLLSDDGVIFVSIDDKENANLRKIMDEIFGEKNFVGDIIRKTRSVVNLEKNGFNLQHENTLVYARHIDLLMLQGDEKDLSRYINPDNDPRGPWYSCGLTVSRTAAERPKQAYDLIDPTTGNVFPPNPNRVWRYIPSSMKQKIEEGRILFPDHPDKQPKLKAFKNELWSKVKKVDSLFGADKRYMNQYGFSDLNALFPEFKSFDYAKPVNFIYELIKCSTEKVAIILDFFAGSSTTAHAVMKMNANDHGSRRFIMVQLPEPCAKDSEPYKAGFRNIAEISRERILRAGKQLKDGFLFPLDTGLKVLKIEEV